MLDQTIEADSTAMADYVLSEQNLRQLAADAQWLRQEMETADEIGQGDEFWMQASKLFGLVSQWSLLSPQHGLEPQAEIALQELAGEDFERAGAVLSLDRVTKALEWKAEAAAASRAEIAERILAAQALRQRAANELGGLEREADFAERAYRAIVRELEEVRITREVDTAGVRVALQAVGPSRPVSPNKLANAVIGGGLGMILGLLMAVWRQYLSPMIGRANPDA